MTEITKKSIVDRWDKMANADLGTWVSPVAAQIRDFFQTMFDCDNGDGWFWSSDFTSSDKIICILRGFQMNTGFTADDGLILSFTLDLHTVCMNSEMLKEFDDYLMCSGKPHSGAINNWLWYWQELIRSEMKPAKKRRSRKSA